MKILITGGAGFIGSNFVHYLLEEHPDNEITVLDKLTYAGRLENLQDIKDKITFIKGDICKTEDVERAIKDCEIIFHFAAESHVDRSLQNATSFVQTNVLGTYRLLDTARKHDISKFIQISTDEVYGQIFEGSFKETDPLNPRNPYSALKAGAELICKAFFTSYGLPILITRSSNNYGPYQYPEKLIPVLILNALHNKPLPIYGRGEQVRDWLYVKDNCKAIDLVSHKGKIGEIYNIGGDSERRNIDVAEKILHIMNKPKSLLNFIADRPGHDFRYSLSSNKIKELGWKPETNFEEGLQKTVKWYLNARWWWKPLYGE